MVTMVGIKTFIPTSKADHAQEPTLLVYATKMLAAITS